MRQEKRLAVLPPPGSAVKSTQQENSAVVQWLRIRALTAEGLGSIPSRGAQVMRATTNRKRAHGMGPLSSPHNCK